MANLLGPPVFNQIGPASGNPDESPSTGLGIRYVHKALGLIKKKPDVHFLGLFDSVAGNRIYTLQNPRLRILNGGEIEPGILHFRHALALDERRRDFMPELYALSSLPQYAHDFQQLWFHGYHSDVGGGVPKDRSGLSRSVLTWMSKEAQKQGLGLTAIQMELAASQPLAANSSDIPILTRAYHYDRARHYDNPHTGILKEVWEEREGLGRPGPRRRNKLVQNS